MSSDERVFGFDFDDSYRLAARFFGVRPETAQVTVSDEQLDARFGPWRVRTPRANIRAATLTGPYHWWRTAGPAHLGITDRSLTFATNGRSGVEIAFHQPVRGIDPAGLLTHPTLTVTVSDCPQLVALLN